MPRRSATLSLRASPALCAARPCWVLAEKEKGTAFGLVVAFVWAAALARVLAEPAKEEQRLLEERPRGVGMGSRGEGSLLLQLPPELEQLRNSPASSDRLSRWCWLWECCMLVGLLFRPDAFRAGVVVAAAVAEEEAEGGLKFLTRVAYLRVLRVCSQQDVAGETAAIMTLRLLRARSAPLRTLVSSLSLKGMWPLSPSIARMHSFSASSERLMPQPSCCVCRD